MKVIVTLLSPRVVGSTHMNIWYNAETACMTLEQIKATLITGLLTHNIAHFIIITPYTNDRLL